MAGSRQDRWPGDFKQKGHIQSSRVPKGAAYYIKDDQDKLRYAIAGGCYQLHEYEGIIRGSKVTGQESPMSLPNASIKMGRGDLVVSPGTKVTQGLASMPTSVPTSISTSIPTHMSAQIPVQSYQTSLTQTIVNPNQTPNFKRRFVEDKDSNSEMSAESCWRQEWVAAVA